MTRMAEYVRVFTTGADDVFVEKRIAAAEGMKSTIRTWTPLQAVEFVAGLSAANFGLDPLPEAIAGGGEQLIQQHASSFVRSAAEGDLQIGVVFAAAIMDVLQDPPASDGWSAADALAASLWSALSFQAPLAQEKVENIRQDLMNAARGRVSTTAHKSRQRREVPPIGPVTISQDSQTGGRVNTAFSKAVEPMVSAIRDNAALDREELDFLWWLLADYSELLSEPFSQMSNEVRAVVRGFDAAAKIRRLPSDGHRHLVLRSIADDNKLTLQEILAATGERREKLALKLVVPDGELKTVFPLALSVLTGSCAASGDIPRTVHEWGARALLEGSILRLLGGGAGKL